MAAGARLQAEWRKQREGLREIKPALTLTAPEEHRRGTEVEPGQVLIKPSDVRPIAGTKEKTLRALAIHVVQNQLTGPYAGTNPDDKQMVENVRVCFSLMKAGRIGREQIMGFKQVYIILQGSKTAFRAL